MPFPATVPQSVIDTLNNALNSANAAEAGDSDAAAKKQAAIDAANASTLLNQKANADEQAAENAVAALFTSAPTPPPDVPPTGATAPQ